MGHDFQDRSWNCDGEVVNERQLLSRAIDIIEEHDAKSLSWGVVEVSETRDFYVNLLYEKLSGILSDLPDFESLFNDLVSNRAVIEFENAEGRYFRSRMANVVFLFSSLRQLLPRLSLSESASLVSDFRFVRRPRMIPIRDRKVDQLFDTDSSVGESEKKFIEDFFELNSSISSLSGFQVRSCQQILDPTSQGVVITAGTGSGKTLAFYLPMLARIAATIRERDHTGVKVLAIYPRNELLKDQLRETLITLKSFNAVLKKEGKRPIRVGTFYGDTPKDSGRMPSSGVCKCLNEACDGNLTWHDTDRSLGREVLRCTRCDISVPGEEFVITREQLQKTLPDILFVGAEMMNRHLSRKQSRELLGIARKSTIQYVLMDEIHTYEGSSGAQTALMLRRWRHRIRGGFPKFVGLSATLENPGEFFSELIGVNSEKIVHVFPFDEEMERRSGEYLLVLRGDPVSKKALLSTAIQSLMLATRAQDSKECSNGVWPPKIFAFTDDLDLVNRLFFDYIDSEGWDSSFGQVRQSNRESLSELRDPDRTSWNVETRRLAQQMGQDWSSLKQSGHSLTKDDIIFDQVSSRNQGIKPNANIIVATSALEVGFNDPEVGLVMQYKTPRSKASYVQRKGRAGRSIDTRPWTVVILSEFGRDRDTFQRYEELISPILKTTHLPIRNIHIQKIQAAMATLDWISVKLNANWIYEALRVGTNRDWTTPALRGVLELTESLISDEATQDELARFIKQSLSLADESLMEVLWQSPRSIFLDFIPALRREIGTDFSSYGQPRKLLENRDSPMPRFITSAMFKALNTPSVIIVPPRVTNGSTSDVSDDDFESMDLFHALREFAPGRISKRFVQRRRENWWTIPKGFELPNQDGTEITVKIANDSIDFTNDFEIVASAGIDGNLYQIVRPLSITTVYANTDQLGITAKSFGRFNWKVEMRTREESKGINLIKRETGPLQTLSLTPYFHDHGCPVEIVRYALDSDATLVTRDRQSKRVKFNFSTHTERVAIGATLLSDGVRFTFGIDGGFASDFIASNQNKYVALNIFRQHMIDSNPFLSPFDVGWLIDCFESFVAAIQINNPEFSVQKICHRLLEDPVNARLIEVPKYLFHQTEFDGEEADLQRELTALLENPDLVRTLAQCMLDSLDGSGPAEQLVTELLARSLSGLVHNLVMGIVPEASERDLVVDTIKAESASDQLTFNVWVTETDPGGSGFLTKFYDRVRSDPQFVFKYILNLCETDESENVNQNIKRLCEQNLNSGDDSKFKVYRDAKSSTAKMHALKGISSEITKMGMYVSSSLLNILQLKILRLGSSVVTDHEVVDLLNQWDEIQSNSQIELSLKAFAFAVASSKHTGDPIKTYTEINKIIDQLYPRGYDVRKSILSFYNSFTESLDTDRILVEHLFSEFSDVSTVVSYPNWELFDSTLRNSGIVSLRVTLAQHERMEVIIADAIMREINYKGLVVFPRFRELRRRDGFFDVIFDLVEAVR